MITLLKSVNVTDIENQVSKILANCEYYGITVDKDLASRLLIDVRNSQESLQKKAYKLCGYHFNFNSSKDVAKVPRSFAILTICRKFTMFAIVLS